MFIFVAATGVVQAIAHSHHPVQMWPLYALWEPSIGPRILLALAVLVAGRTVWKYVARAPRAIFLTAIVIFTSAFAISVAVEGSGVKTDTGCCARGSPAAQITAPFRDSDSYFANVQLVDRLGPRAFASNYQTLDQPPYTSLSIHALTHPPGAPLLLWATDEAVGESLLSVCLLMIVLGALSSVATYLIALEVYGERAARFAALLFCLAPAVVLFLATSMDAVFMTMIALTVAALVRAPRSNVWAAVSGALWMLALSFTFAALALGVVVAGIAITSLRRHSLRDLVIRGLWLTFGVVGSLTLLWVTLGLDLPAIWKATTAAHSTLASTYRPYAYWVWANLVAFALVAGIPQSALFLSDIAARWKARQIGWETVTLATLVALTISNVFKGEVDHIWLFMMPAVAATAGARIASLTDGTSSDRLPGRAFAVSAAQTLLMQILLYTYW